MLTVLLLVAAIVFGCWILKFLAALLDVVTGVPMGLTYVTLLLLVLSVCMAI